MHIRSIQLQGFKSFADKVTLDFSDGISAVVGPNGCGKSNILDAAKWCFGSQSPKQMRGASMQDVIFGGSSKRPEAGFAEVSVTFDNADMRAPGPWREVAEIRLTRRVDRAGDSDYLMNGARVRLKEIQEFLMDIGYGEYSMVQQGSVGQLVQAKPDEVRVFLEQASRMTKFRARREEAQRKLERTEENLERVLDLLQEIERQMKSLQRQAEKAQKALEIEGQWRDVARILLTRELVTLEQEQVDAASALRQLADKIQAERSQISTLEAQQEEVHERLEAVDGEFQAVLDAQQELQSEREQTGAQLSALQREQGMLQAQAEQGAAELAALQAQHAELQETLQRLTPECAEAVEVYETVNTQYQEVDTALRQARDQHAELVHHREVLRNDLVELLRRESELKSDASQATIERDHAHARLEEQGRRHADLETRLKELRDQLVQAQLSAREQQAERERIAQNLEDTSRALQQAKDRVRAAHETETVATRRQQDLKIERQKVAEALSGADLNAVLPEGGHAGVLLPWERVAPKPGREDLVGTALSARFQTLLVESPEIAEAVWNASADQANEHRVRWLSLEQLPAEIGRPPLGYTGFSELLSYSEADAAWVQALTFGVWFSEQPLQPGQPLPAGDWIELWDATGTSVTRLGIWSRGPLSQSGRAHLAARRNELNTELAQTEQALGEARSETEAAEAQRAELQRRLDELTQTLDDARREADAAAHRVELLEEERRRQSEQGAELGEDRERLTAARQQAEEILDAASIELEAIQDRIGDIRNELELSERDVEPLAERIDALEHQQTELQASLERSREAKHDLSRRLDAAKEQSRHRTDRMESLTRQAEEARVRTREIDVEQEQLNATLERLNKALFERADEIQTLQKSQQTIRETQVDLEKRLREHNQQLDRYLQEKAKIDHARSELEHRVDHALEQFSHRFGVAFEPAAEPDDRSDEELEAEAEALQQRRERLGQINPAALEEYDEIKERHDSMAAQREDLLASIDSLRRSIQRMNRESRERFKEAFENVNRLFTEIFTKLFRGGHAELRLTDPDDWLESGVEVVAQPPGTNLQRLELLSGGQSAMTALALILAIFMTHPSPFCVLDEVDAPLDDANISRFNQVLIELNEIAQIFLITHNKRTMEIADTLYGITMEEKGVSKAIPVRLT